MTDEWNVFIERMGCTVKFKICAIGGGWMATQGHGPAYREYAEENPEVELAACCDIDEEVAKKYKERFGFSRYYTDIFHMLEKEKPDAVCLIVPVHLTAPLAMRIMELGYPLIMEKPPGINKEETLNIIKIADEGNIPNQVAFNRRFTPLIKKLKDELTAKYKPSDIQNIQYFMYRVGRIDDDFSTTAIHGIDATRYLAGSDYKHVRFFYQELPELGEGVANIFMDCTFVSGTTAQLSFCPVTGVTIERAIANTHGHTYFLDIPIWGGIDSPGRLLHIKDDKVDFDISGHDICSSQELYKTNGFYDENVSFFNDIRAGRKPINNVKTALQSVEIAECIRERLTEYKL